MTGVAAMQAFAAVSVLLGALLLLRTANIPRERRHQQFGVPVLAVVFAAVVAVVLYLFNEWFDALLALVFRFLPFLEGFYQTRWLYIIENVLIVVVFLGLKHLYRRLAPLLFSRERFVGSTVVEHFYDYDVASGRWNVKSHLSQVRTLYQVLYWGSLGVTGVWLWAMQQEPGAPAFAAIAFPALAVVVLGEIWWALDGLTQEEAGNLLTGEDDAARRVANYAALREVFRTTFPDRVVDEGVDLSHPYGSNSHLALTQLTRSDDRLEQLFGQFFERAKRAGQDVDENLIHAALSVSRGSSTLINTPFYADLTPYLALPSYARLLGGGKCLIVTGRDSSASDVADWFASALEGITGVPGLWTVGVITHEGPEDLDVGVLRLADLHDLALLREYDDFFHETETVLLLEPSRLLTTGQLGLSVVVSRLAHGPAPVYVALDRNHDGLVDALSHLLKVNITDVVATTPALGASSEMVWDANGPQLAAHIMPGVSRYLGVGTEIAAVALKYHVSQVEWVGGDTFPVTDMSWIAGQYYGTINAFAEMALSQRALESALIPRAHPLALERTRHRFLVVEDELSNVYESIRLFASRSTESGFINLISEDYLLRDYMVHNRELFSVDAKAIPSIVPDYARTPRNTVLRLIVMLSAYDVPESTLLRELELVNCVPGEAEDSEHGAFEAPVVTLLIELAARYLGATGTRIEPVERRGDPAGAERRFRIPSSTPLDRVIAALGPAYFLVEDEAEGRDFIGGCLRNHMEQTVLPGQFLTVGGKYYEVQRMSGQGQRAEVVLRRAAEHIVGRPAYRPLRTLRIAASAAADRSAPHSAGAGVTIERQVMDFSVRTRGYLDLPGRSALPEARVVTVPELAERQYVHKEGLRIGLPGSTAAVRGTIALLLNELFVTIFPSGHPFILAVTSDPDGAFGELLPTLETETGRHPAPAGDDDAIYIVEDSLVDLGLTVAVERHWRRLLATVTDYLAWVQEAPEPSADATPGPIVFPGETAEDIAERERRTAEAEERGSYLEAAAPGWWTRVIRRIRGWVTRGTRPAGDAGEADAPAAGTAGAGASADEFAQDPMAYPGGQPQSAPGTAPPLFPDPDPDRGLAFGADTSAEETPSPAETQVSSAPTGHWDWEPAPAAGAGSAAVPDPESWVAAGAGVEVLVGAGDGTDVGLGVAAGAAPDAGADPDPDPDPDPDSVPHPESERDPEFELEPVTEPVTEQEPESGPTAEPEIAPEPAPATESEESGDRYAQ